MSNYRKHKNPQVHVRLPQELKDWVTRKAEREGVPVNTMFVKCVESMRKIEEMAA
jgi:predicted HicB family RNase H-like nuclease